MTNYSIYPTYGSSSVSEASGGIWFTVYRDNAWSTTPAYVSTLAGSATYGQGDYGYVVDTPVIFSYGSNYANVFIPVNNDVTYEGNEYFSVAVTEQSIYNNPPILAQQYVSIVDDDTPTALPPNVSISDASTYEGGQLVFTVQLDQVADRNITVNYFTQPGTASQSAGDYQGASTDIYGQGSVVIYAGTSSAQVYVSTFQNGDQDTFETMQLVLQQTSYGNIIDNSGQGYIYNSDTAPATFSLTGPTTVAENGGSISFTLTRSGGSGAQTVYVTTLQNQGSTNSADYTGKANEAFTFAAGETTKTITIPITE